LRAFTRIGHGLKKIVVDGGANSAEQRDVINGFHAGNGLFHALNHKTAAVVYFIFKTLYPAGGGIRNHHIGLTIAKGAHGKDTAGGADIVLHPLASRIPKNFGDGIAFFHGALDHGFTGSASRFPVFSLLAWRCGRRFALLRGFFHNSCFWGLFARAFFRSGGGLLFACANSLSLPLAQKRQTVQPCNGKTTRHKQNQSQTSHQKLFHLRRHGNCIPAALCLVQTACAMPWVFHRFSQKNRLELHAFVLARRACHKLRQTGGTCFTLRFMVCMFFVPSRQKAQNRARKSAPRRHRSPPVA